MHQAFHPGSPLRRFTMNRIVHNIVAQFINGDQAEIVEVVDMTGPQISVGVKFRLFRGSIGSHRSLDSLNK